MDNNSPPNFELFAQLWVQQDTRVPADPSIRAEITRKLTQILSNRYHQIHPEAKLKTGARFQLEESLFEGDADTRKALVDQLTKELENILPPEENHRN